MGLPVTVTPELLASAWAEARRPNWPESFEAAMRHPLLRRLVRARAIGMAIAQARPPQHTTSRTPAFTRTAPAWDARRAAANDLENTDA